MLFKSLMLTAALAGALYGQAPTILGINPDTAVVGTGVFPILAYGSNFQPGATIYWNNTPLITHYNGPLSLTADMPFPMATAAGTAQITVRGPGGITSNAALFTIRTTPATPNFIGAAPTFAGNRVVYVAGRDRSDGNNTDWQAAGTWMVQ